MSRRLHKPLFLLSLGLTLTLPPLRRALWAALLSLLLSWAVRRCVGTLTRRGLPRRWAVTAVGLALLSVSALAVWAAVWAVWSALDRAAALLPDPGELFARARTLAASLPDGLGTLALQAVDALALRSTQLRDALLLRSARLSARLLARVPGTLFFLLIVGLSACYAAADWSHLAPVLRRAVPEDWRNGLDRGLTLLRRGLSHWLAVQGRLLLLQFLLLTVGLLLLGQRAAGAVAALAALSDALPLLGTGAVLLPLAALRWLEGEGVTALGLMLLTLCCWALRTVLEPRLVGQRCGVSPFFTLLGVYVGAQCFGVAGMVGALILAGAVGRAAPGGNRPAGRASSPRRSD